MKLAAKRDLTVRYYEKEGNPDIWITESHMVDEEHDIMLNLGIDMQQMVIVSVNITFNRYPLKECKLVEKKADQLIGQKVDRNFSRNIMSITMGPEGCPNLMILLSITVPGIIYYYYPYKIRTGMLTQEKFMDILRENERNACLAHTLFFSDNQ